MRINLHARIAPELLALFTLLGAVWLVGAASAGATDSELEFSVHTQIAVVDGVPVVPAGWVADQVAAANTIFEPTGVQFANSREDTSDLAPDLVTRTDRHRIGPRVDLSTQTIHVFVVRSMQDVDEPGRTLRGVHWRSRRGGGPRHFVVLTSIAGRNTLAHELGHFFGNPHSPTPGNIMSYLRGDMPPFFDATQQRRIRRHAQQFVASDELLPISPR